MTDAIARLNDALRDRYSIERKVGEGGMATVYLAEDIRHERKVALKVLKPDLAAVVGADRFLAEIKTTAKLQHPHILPLHDSGEAGGFLFYVMPYVEGESLRERLDRENQLPVDEAVRIATAVASALQAAHEQGIIHRDIKPANILLSRGQPLVSDFGIALAVGSAGGDRLTETGLSVGTPYYMSPEQATGDQAITSASDTYALACVLYEMLVGEPPHVGASAQAVLSKILAGDLVSPTTQRPTVPEHVDAALRRALERLPADRFTTVESFAAALADPAFRYGVVRILGAASGSVAWKAATLVGWSVALAAVAWAGLRSPDTPSAQVVRAQVPTEEGNEWGWAGGVNIALSPDGSSLVYVGKEHLWLRQLDGLETMPINGTQWGRNPVISPDGSELAYVAMGSLRSTSLQGGPSTVLIESGIRDARGGFDWADDGGIFFVDLQGAIRRSPPGGGEGAILAEPEQGELFGWIDALPRDRGLLLTIIGGATDLSQIAVLDFETGDVRALFPGTTARYVDPGFVVYASPDSTLSVIPFDLDGLATAGAPSRMIDKVDVHPGSASQFAVSRSGTLVYAIGSVQVMAHPVRVDRSGNATPVDPDWTITSASDYGSLALSPDGERLVVSSLASGTVDLWIKPLTGGPDQRITFSGTLSVRASWAPDGSAIAFVSDRAGQMDAWSTRPDGGGEAVTLLDRPLGIYTIAYSPDQEWLVYGTLQGADLDVRATRLGTGGEDIPIRETEFDEVGPAVSPDSRWVAFASNHSGRFEVYVSSFPDPLASGLTLVSNDGGKEPVWAQNGNELFYRNGANELVSVRYTANGTFEVDGREVLFTFPEWAPGPGQALYAVSPDAQSFYMLREIPPESTARLMLLQNFLQEAGTAPAG